MMLGAKDAIRIVPYFVLPQFFLRSASVGAKHVPLAHSTLASSYYSNTGNSGIATVGTSAKVLCFASITKTSKASVFSSALKVFILFLLRFYEFQFLLMPVLFRG